MKVILGSDHRGIALKQAAEELLQELKIPFEDVGTHSSESCDYPDYAAKVGRAVAGNEDHRGLLFCGTGIGMAMAANKVHGIRAAAVADEQEAILSRKHNDANVLALGELAVTPERARSIIRAWLDAQFEGGRHQTRVDKITELEKTACQEQQG